MKVVSTSTGFALIFKNLADLQMVSEHLQGQVEAAEEGALEEGKYIYAILPDDSSLSLKEKLDFVHKLKLGKI